MKRIDVTMDSMSSTKHQVIFHNFPSCSILLDEIIMNHSMGDQIEFHTFNTTLQSINFIKENPKAFIIFYNDSPKDYIQAKSMLKQICDERGSLVCSMAIVNNSDPTVEKSLRALGVRNIFTHDYHAPEIIDKMEYLLKNNFREQKKKLHIPKKISQMESEDMINLVVDSGDRNHDNFKQIVSSNFDNNDLNLESGEMKIDLNIANDLVCTLENFESNQIELKLKGSSHLKKDDLLELNILFKYNRCKVEVMLDGIVHEVESLPESDLTIVVINLNNDESVSLENFMSLYQKRQKSIDEFLELAKGY